MPRKTQFIAEDVVTAAFELVREKGLAGLSAPAVAGKMGCSTMPIYSYFENLEKLKDAVVINGWGLLMAYEGRSYTGDVWVDHSMGYIQFAMDEENLFFCMFDGRNIELQRKMALAHWKFLYVGLKDYPGFEGLELEQVFLIRYSRALFTHGLAAAATGNWGKLLQVDGMIENLVMAASRALLEGYRKNYEHPNKNIAFLDEKIKSMFEAHKEDFQKETLENEP